MAEESWVSYFVYPVDRRSMKSSLLKKNWIFAFGRNIFAFNAKEKCQEFPNFAKSRRRSHRLKAEKAFTIQSSAT
jgi:hypothetical protein